MNTQELLDPKSWAERTFGGVQLHDRRRTSRALQAATKLAENPWALCLLKCTPGKRPKRCIVCADRASCHLCCFDAASLATDERTSQCLSGGAVGAKIPPTSIYPIVDIHQWSRTNRQRTRTGIFRPNAAGRASSGTGSPRVRGSGTRMSRIPAPDGEQRYQRRQREKRKTDVWMRQVSAIGTPELGSRWVHV
jgi:hypothetical protein